MTGELASVTPLPADNHSYRYLQYRYHDTTPPPGTPAYVEHCVEDQLRLAHEIWGDSDLAWLGLTVWNPALTAEALEPLFDAADVVHDAIVNGPQERFYRVVDDYADTLHLLARSVRSAYDARLAVTR